MLPIHSENQVPGKVSTAQGCWRQVIEQHKVGGGPDCQRAQAREIATKRAKDGSGNASVILKSHLRHDVARHAAWVAKEQLRSQVGSLHLLQHIHAEAVVAQAKVNTII